MDQLTEKELADFVENCKTLVLSTISADEGFPDASYAPFVWSEGRFYIFISGLAKHTRNLLPRSTANGLALGECSVMLIADEKDSTNLFARRRLTYRCVAQELDRGTSKAESILDSMTKLFGPTVGMLRSLPDFRLFELVPSQGLFVKGFGQAIQLG